MAEINTIVKRWIISPNDLRKKYQIANQRVVHALQKYGSSKVEVQADGTLSYPSDVGNENRKERPLPQHLSIEEELFIQRFYEGKVQEVCEAFRFPNKIQATAIMYFKRFYQQWSVMELDPKKIMLTCVYVACKLEENYVSAEEFGRGLQEDPLIFYKYEMFVLESIEFDLMVYTPYRALQGFIYNLEPFVQHMGSVGLQTLEELQKIATIGVNKMMLTNAPLHYPPSQLALAALWIANQNESKIDFERYLQTLPIKEKLQQSFSKLMANLNAIEVLVKANSKEPSDRTLRYIGYKLRCCRNSNLLLKR